jgi:hypothetical protein
MDKHPINKPERKTLPWLKFSMGYIIIIIVGSIATIWVMQSVGENNTRLTQSSETLTPLKENISSLQFDISKIKHLTSDCIYNPGPDVKSDLKILVENIIPEKTNQLFDLRKKIPSDYNPSLLNKTGVECIDFAQSSSEILNRLSNDTSYSDDSNIDMVIYIYNDLLIPKFDMLRNDFDTYLKEINQKEAELQSSLIATNHKIKTAMLSALAIIVICCIAFSIYAFVKNRT